MKDLETLDILDCIDETYETAVHLHRCGIPKKSAVYMLIGYANAVLDLCGQDSVEYEYAEKKVRILKHYL